MYNPLMKRVLLIFALILSVSLRAQAPEPARLPGEPHHHLKIDNAYLRAYYVEVAPHESTQLHQHDHDYLFVTLGPSDVINAVLDKPEVHLVLKDGETHFTRGGFAHVARNLSDAPFRNITIELLHPQQSPRNICKQVMPGPVTDCSGPPINRIKDFPDKGSPIFMTDEVHAREFDVAQGGSPMDMLVGPDALLVSLTSPGLKLHIVGEPQIEFTAGEVAWIPAGKKCSLSAPSGTPLHILELSFRNPAGFAKP